MMECERWAKNFEISNTIECFSELIKIAQFYFSIMAHYANVERFFPRYSNKLKEREIFLVEPVSSLFKAGVQFQTPFMQAVSQYC